MRSNSRCMRRRRGSETQNFRYIPRPSGVMSKPSGRDTRPGCQDRENLGVQALLL
jgi:hypothetical protein